MWGITVPNEIAFPPILVDFFYIPYDAGFVADYEGY